MKGRNSERGAAAVEFALVVPLLIMLVFGIAEFGRAFFVQATLAGAAREGVRAMAIGTPADGTIAAQKVLTTSGITGPTLAPGTACPTPGPNPPNATFTVNWDMPSITGIFKPTFKLKGVGVMRCNG